jgi:cyclopropane-fatty-acyl-phospholipid synthase
VTRDAALIPLPPRVSARRAAEILQRVFGRLATGFAFRLWDGTLVPLGAGAPVCTAVIHRPETFLRLIREPTPLNFAEAYVEGAIDLEGDLFAAMRVADAIEDFRISAGERIRILFALWRG